MVLSTLFAAALTLVGPSGSAQPAPIDIHAILSLTGGGAFLGKGEQASALAFEKMINSSGGINGRPIRMVIEDDQTNPAVTRQLADALSGQHVPAIVGPSMSAMALAIQPDAEKGMVVYGLTNAISPPAGSYLYSASVSIYQTLVVMYRYFQDKGVRKVAVLSSTDATGMLGAEQAVEALKRPEFKNMQLTAQERFAPTDLSVAAQVERIKSSGAEAVVAWTVGTPFATVLRGVHDAGYNGIVATNTGNMLPSQLKNYVSFLPDKLLFTTPSFLGAPVSDPGMRRARDVFVSAMHANGVNDPDQANVIAWDPFLILADALRHVGPNPTGKKVHDYISQLRGFPGITGIYDFRAHPQRGLGEESVILARWDPNTGNFIPVSKAGGAPL